MYEKYYGLKRSPFGLSPDPRFFFPTQSHDEALAVLRYGVLQRKGIVVITGEVGTGKTMLLQYLLDLLARASVTFAFVANPRLSVTEFLSFVLNDLRLTAAGRTKGEMLSCLNDYLLARSRRNAITAIVVDEAHLLNWELMEEIRLLTNLETFQHKLVQLVLAGQPELDQRLDSPELRQLKQRISFRCQLTPLTYVELRGYVQSRLEHAGAKSSAATIFPDETIAAIYEFSGGIPRIVNNLCENSMVAGYGKQMPEITAEIVREVASELRLSQVAITSLEDQQGPDAGIGVPLVSTGEAMPEPLTQSEQGAEKP